MNHGICKRTNVLPLCEYQRNILVCSSAIILIPAYYAHNREFIVLSTISSVTSFVSINYWRLPIIGLRRNLDLGFSKLLFAVYFLLGSSKMLYLRNDALLGCISIIINYIISSILWEKDNSYWIYFHVGFHVSVALEQCIVIGTL